MAVRNAFLGLMIPGLQRLCVQSAALGGVWPDSHCLQNDQPSLDRASRGSFLLTPWRLTTLISAISDWFIGVTTNLKSKRQRL